MTIEELTKALEGLQTQVTDLTRKAAEADAARAAAEAALETLTKSAAEAGLDVQDGKIVKRAEPEYVEIAGTRVEKALVPEPVLKALEQQAADIAKMKAQAEEIALAKRGETELPNLAGTALAKGRLLAMIGDDAELLKALKAADAAMATQFIEKGHSRVEDEASPEYRLDQMTKAYQAQHAVPYETAYAAVLKTAEGRALYRAHRDAAN